MIAGRRIRILVAEDHVIARFGLRGLVDQEPDMQVVAEAKHGGEAVEKFRTHRPDLVLMDLRMPEMDGIQATTTIRHEDPTARILVLSSYDADDEIRRAFDAGAAGYIMKEADAVELFHAIRVVQGGGPYVPPRIAARLAARVGETRLTSHERRILQLISKGLSNREIAGRVSLAPGTVRIYVSNILSKLGAGNRAEAVARALEHGIIRND